MKRVLLAATALAALAHPAAAQPSQAQPGRLPPEVVPVHYDVAVTPDAAGLTLKGEVRIAVDVLKPTRAITLNAADMTFQRATLDGRKAARLATDPAAETVTLGFDAPVAPGRHTLALAYTGKINRSAAGLFALDYDTAQGSKRALFTQFENSDARRFMPSWDEPGRKATFTLSVTAPVGQTVVSNMPATSTKPVGGGLQQVVFRESPKMSSYLLFLGMGDLERKTVVQDGVEIGVVAKRGSVANGELALQSAAPLLHFYNDYFGTPYPLPKMDMLAGPGNSQFFGAMENWGAIFYFERALLVDPRLTTESERQGVYATVAHEMAHQWFGDLVTMNWWDDLWLNEGFASWMASKAVRQFHPEWRPEVKAVTQRETAMTLDARSTSHPVVQKIETVAQASQAFDRITYAKGQAVIGMLEAYVGADAWRDGLRRYMKTHAYGNTVTDQFWADIAAASGKPILGIAHDFTLQAGVPLIRVAASRCDGGNTTLTLSQARFGVDDGALKPTTWRVPVTAQVLGASQGATAIVSGPGETVMTLPGCGPAVVNAGQSGYYRTLYSAEAMTALTGAFGRLDAADQLGLLADSWALGKAGFAPVTRYLDLARAAPVEADPLVWQHVADTLDEIDGYYADGPERTAFRAAARKLLAPAMARVGWDAKADESPNVALARAGLIAALGDLGDPTVVAEAHARFERWLADPASVSAGARKSALSVVARNADAATWERLHARARASTVALEKLDLYQLLGEARDPALAGKALALAITDEPGPTNGPAVIGRVAERHPELAFNFVVDHEKSVYARIETSSRTRYVPGLIATSNDPALAEKMSAYARKTFPEQELGAAKSGDAAVRFRARIARERLPEIVRWTAAQGD